MEELFLNLLNMSISASWLVLAILLARVVLKKAPRSLICALWALVAIRLVFPFSIESVLSMIPSARTVPTEILLDPEPTINSGVTFIDSAVNPVLSQSMAPVEWASANPMQIWAFLAGLVWAFGVVVMVIYALYSYLRLRIKVGASVERDGVYLCDYIDSPFILGIIRPRIYLPSGLEGENAAYVIAHERAHLKRADHWWKPLGFALLTVHWFNPIMWVAYVLLCRDIELACDERVVKDMGTEEKKAYSCALLECSVPRRMIAACPLAFGEVGVKARVKSVLNYKKPAFWGVVVALIACVAVAVCFMTDPVEEPEPDPFVQADSPWQWTSQVGSEDVDFCQATIWGDEQRHIAIEGANLDGLIAHLNDIEESEVRLGDSGDHSVSVMVKCADAEYLLQYGDGRVWFVFDSATAAKYPDGEWVIDNTALTGWFEDLLIPAEPMENAQEASLSQGYANMTLTLPEGWEYMENRSLGTGEKLMYFGISFRPEGEQGWVELQFWPDRFGVCGTGLEEKQITLNNGLRATQGFYDGGKNWSYMVFNDLPGSYVVRRSGTEGWWDVREDTVMSILGSARLAEGIIRQSRAVEIARQILNPDIDYPLSRSEFDYVAGTWKVDFYLDTGASRLGRSVTVNHLGEIGDDWGVTLSASDVTPEGMTLTITQEGAIDVMPIGSIYPGSMSLMTGRHFWLEQWNGSGWEEVPTKTDAIFTTEGLGIPFGDSVSWNVSWKWLYGELSGGTYRMGKHISLNRALGENEDRTYYVTFEVSNSEEEAILSAIRAQHEHFYSDIVINTESYVQLGRAVSDPLAGESGHTVVIYAVVMRDQHVGSVVSHQITVDPVAMTFRVDQGKYELVEYWVPESGEGYEASVLAKFPADCAQKALSDDYNDQLRKACDEQAKAEMERIEAEGLVNTDPYGPIVAGSSFTGENYSYSGDGETIILPGGRLGLQLPEGWFDQVVLTATFGNDGSFQVFVTNKRIVEANGGYFADYIFVIYGQPRREGYEAGFGGESANGEERTKTAYLAEDDAYVYGYTTVDMQNIHADPLGSVLERSALIREIGEEAYNALVGDLVATGEMVESMVYPVAWNG